MPVLCVDLNFMEKDKISGLCGKKIGASKFDFLEDWILFIVQDTNYVHETLQADK